MAKLHAGYKTLRAATDKIKELEKELSKTGERYIDTSLIKCNNIPCSRRKY